MRRIIRQISVVVLICAGWIAAVDAQPSPHSSTVTASDFLTPPAFTCSFDVEDQHGKYSVAIDPLDDSTHRLTIRRTATDDTCGFSDPDVPDATGDAAWSTLLPWPVYQCETADVDGNGRADILVGVIKTCMHDPTLARRLFVYEIVDGVPHPKWLGTTLSDQLIAFSTTERDSVLLVQTVERDAQGGIHHGEYRWDGFGFVRLTYHHESYGGNGL